MNYPYSIAINQIRKELNEHRPSRVKIDGAVPAAVLILILNQKENPHILFTKRSTKVETHKGQISFVGGVLDKGDKNAAGAAIREAEEEIGVKKSKIEIVCQLDDFYTVTNYAVTPFVATLHPPFTFTRNQDEVAEIIQVPLSEFFSNDNFEIKKWQHNKKLYDVYFYYYKNQIIWGATAHILKNFIKLAFKFDPEADYNSDDKNLMISR